MTEFIPPRPPVLPKKASLIQLAQIGLRSGLSMFMDTSYDQVKAGRYGLFTLWRGRKRWLYMMRNPDQVREVMVKRAADFPKSTLMHAMLSQLTGDSIFTTNGAVWLRQRRMMEPAFEGARIKDVFPMMLEASEASLARIDAHLEKTPDKPFDFEEELTHFAADVIFRTIFTEPIDYDAAMRIIRAFNVFQDVSYAHGFLRMMNVPVALLPGNWRALRAAKVIRGELNKLVLRRLDLIEKGLPHPQTDIMTSLLKARDPATGTAFDAAELLDQVAMLFLAGHETSAASMGWAVYLLAQCQHIQERMHAEAMTVYGDRDPAFSDMKRLPLARDVFREALRLYPPVAFVSRDTTKDEPFGKRTAPPGSVVFVSQWLMHRHNAYWDHPDAFDPDRFDTEKGKEGLRCAYLPFSMGPRVCAGASFALQEAVLHLSQMVKRFRLLPAPGHTPIPVSRLTLRSDNGMPLMVERR